MSVLNIFRRLHGGVVIAKHHYAGGGVQKFTETNLNKGAAMVTVFTQSTATPESFSLIVQGTDKSGRHQLTRERYVDAWTWASTELGSKYPPASS